ncbi:hypothetical protein pb186bvf_019374 [Paramecium bursaria]
MNQVLYNHESKATKIESYGVATSRFQSILIQREFNRLLLPLTTSLVAYDLKSLEVLYKRQTNKSTIYSMNQSEQFIFTIGFDGDITKLNRESLEIIDSINFKIGCQCRWTSVLGDIMAVTAERSFEHGTVQIFNIQTFKPIVKFEPQYIFGTIIQNEARRYYLISETKYNTKSEEELAQLSENERLKLENQQKYQYSLHIYDENQTLLKDIPFGIIGEILHSEYSDKYIIYSLRDKQLVVFNIQTNEMKFIKIDQFKSMVYCYKLQGDLILFSDGKHQLVYLNILDEQINIVKLNKGISESPQSLLWDNETIIVVNEQEISVIEKGNVISKNFGGLTKCGIDFYQDNPVSGDFEGKVQIQGGEEIFVGMPVRSLATYGNQILIGTMDGTVYLWANGTLEQFASLEGSITCIRVRHNLILLSSTQGQVHLYNQKQTIHKFVAHHPQQKSEGFGSLNLFAEVWSTIFHPFENLFATASEDQTVKIFQFDNESYEEIAILRGHENAVTCLDWKQNYENVVLLFTCSDDRTVRVYEKYELQYIINTKFVNEWHTLTYMGFQNGGSILAIGAQNGYLFLYCIKEQRFIFAQKVHMGGIEGLAIKQNKVATCSSDNSVNVIYI